MRDIMVIVLRDDDFQYSGVEDTYKGFIDTYLIHKSDYNLFMDTLLAAQEAHATSDENNRDALWYYIDDYMTENGFEPVDMVMSDVYSGATYQATFKK